MGIAKFDKLVFVVLREKKLVFVVQSLHCVQVLDIVTAKLALIYFIFNVSAFVGIKDASTQ